jgi:hypothetical protein
MVISSFGVAAEIAALAPPNTTGLRPAMLNAAGTELYAAIRQPGGPGVSDENFELWAFGRTTRQDRYNAPIQTNLDVSGSNLSHEVTLSYVSADDRFWFTQVEGSETRVRSAELLSSPGDFYPNWIDEWVGFPDGSGLSYLGASLTSDGLTLITSVPLGGSRELREYVRTSVLDAWGPVTTLASVNEQSSDDREPWISSDGLLLVLASDRVGNQFDLYYSCRENRGGPWAAPALVPTVNTANVDERAPVGWTDGSTIELYYSQERTSGAWSEQLMIATP